MSSEQLGLIERVVPLCIEATTLRFVSDFFRGDEELRFFRERRNLVLVQAPVTTGGSFLVKLRGEVQGLLVGAVGPENAAVRSLAVLLLKGAVEVSLVRINLEHSG